MKINNSLRIGSTWIALAGIGAAVALLLAPQSGRRTRRKILLTSGRCWDSLTGELEKAQDQAREITRKVTARLA
jgi:gas vesicle protein